MSDKLPTSQLAPEETTSSTSYKSRLIARFVLEHNPHLLDGSQRNVQRKSGKLQPPVMLSMQGPQGAGEWAGLADCERCEFSLQERCFVAGKSTLAASLQALLQDQPYGLNVAVVSLDGQFIVLPSSPCRSHPDLALLRSNTVSWRRNQISI